MLTTEYTWDCFYDQHRQQREWYLTRNETIHHLQNLLQQYLPNTSALSIYHSGCGTSNLCIDLSNNLVEKSRVTNTDFSQPVVDIMAARHPTLHFIREDARSTTFSDNSFHLIVDKGTLDAASSSSAESETNVASILNDYHRVLMNKGLAVIFSLYGSKEWQEKLRIVENIFEIKIYTLDKTHPGHPDHPGHPEERSEIGIRNESERIPEHVMRTEEVGGEINETYMIVLVPLKESSKESNNVNVNATYETKNNQEYASASDSDSSHSGNEDHEPTQVACIKCQSSLAIFECDPCGCISYCKKCAMKVASGGKCKQCGKFYGGVRRNRK